MKDNQMIQGQVSGQKASPGAIWFDPEDIIGINNSCKPMRLFVREGSALEKEMLERIMRRTGLESS